MTYNIASQHTGLSLSDQFGLAGDTIRLVRLGFDAILDQRLHHTHICKPSIECNNFAVLI